MTTMGVTIEQYRARVGIHVNILRQREMARHLTGNLWNTMLLLFYLNVFYLPTLKEMDKQYKKSNEVAVCFIKMVRYHQVYVSGLLRLSNDIETNPGQTVYDIVDPTKTICADFSQGCQTRFGQNAGKQCVAMSLTSIVYSQI